MLFNSFEFLVFLPTVFFFYWFVFNKSLRLQNLLLLISSYVFYGWWDWRFLSLILLSTIVDYYVGLKIYSCEEIKLKKKYLWVSLLFNFGLLAFFKYFNFFIDSWTDLLSLFGYDYASRWTLNIILPLGISFYTFQTMSYSLDIYNKNLKPTKDFISFASFVCFFPQLVAGPIERASNLLPQILKTRNFRYVQGAQGIKLILWGLFKKIVIADSLSLSADIIFSDYSIYNGGVLLLGLIYFSFQIYCDFSGYSDIAIGVSKLFGFEIMSNFKFPYFSRNIGEFWHKWHISLSTWFRDYLYIPLGGSKKGKLISIRNTFIIFITSGIWHGANLTFIVWGLIHFLLFIPSLIKGKNRKYLENEKIERDCLNYITDLIRIVLTFSLITIAWVFFRSNTVRDSFHYLYYILQRIALPDEFKADLIFVLIFLLLEFVMKKSERNLFQIKNPISRTLLYVILSFTTLLFYMHSDINSFIYFQF